MRDERGNEMRDDMNRTFREQDEDFALYVFMSFIFISGLVIGFLIRKWMFG